MRTKVIRDDDEGDKEEDDSVGDFVGVGASVVGNGLDDEEMPSVESSAERDDDTDDD